MLVAEIIFWGCLAYALMGLAVSVPFVWRGVDKVDASAQGASWAFRLVILPGCVALWPWIVRWLPLTLPSPPRGRGLGEGAKGVGHS